MTEMWKVGGGDEGGWRRGWSTVLSKPIPLRQGESSSSGRKLCNAAFQTHTNTLNFLVVRQLIGGSGTSCSFEKKKQRKEKASKKIGVSEPLEQ